MVTMPLPWRPKLSVTVSRNLSGVIALTLGAVKFAVERLDLFNSTRGPATCIQANRVMRPPSTRPFPANITFAASLTR